MGKEVNLKIYNYRVYEFAMLNVFCISLQRPLINDLADPNMYAGVLVDKKELYRAEQRAISKGCKGGPAFLLNAVICSCSHGKRANKKVNKMLVIWVRGSRPGTAWGPRDG